MRRIIVLLYSCLLAIGIAGAQESEKLVERMSATIDKQLYLTGEVLHISLQLTDAEGNNGGLSRVAYVELSDTKRTFAQGMAMLDKNGLGWTDISLPSAMHSGYYLLTAYTRYMRTEGPEVFYKQLVPVLNLLRVSREDQVRYLDSTYTITEGKTYQAGQTLMVKPSSPSAVSLVRLGDLQLASEARMPQARATIQMSEGWEGECELEGHVVVARPVEKEAVTYVSRLSQVGQSINIYDGQPQADGSFAYYTHLSGRLPMMLNGYDADNNASPMRLVSPYAGVVADSLPMLRVNYNPALLKQRSLAAQQEQAWQEQLEGFEMKHSEMLLNQEPDRIYDLDEYVKFNSVNEILIEFVRGVRRSKEGGVHKLYTFQPEQNQYSKWEALVLLDGMPVYDVDVVLRYDARRLKYVQIYNGKYTFGEHICQGVISFISKKGLLSNYQLDKGSRMFSYDFPHDHQPIALPAIQGRNTLYWNPYVTEPIQINLPAEPGVYQLRYEGKEEQIIIE